MKINYDTRLVSFVQEVNLLSKMGFKIAPQIFQSSKIAEQFMQQAEDLKKANEIKQMKFKKSMLFNFEIIDC